MPDSRLDDLVKKHPMPTQDEWEKSHLANGKPAPTGPFGEAGWLVIIALAWYALRGVR